MRRALRKSSNQTVSETIILDYCSEGWSCWRPDHSD